MKKIFFLLFAAFFLSAVINAQTSIGFESLNRISLKTGYVTPIGTIYGRWMPENSQFGVSVWSLTQPGWAEVYPGIIYAPTKWLEFNASFGIETGGKTWRSGASVWMGNGKISFFSCWEKGGGGNDNYWYLNRLNFNFSKKFGAGLKAMRYHGWGPELLLSPNKRVTITMAFLYDLEAKVFNGQYALKVKF